MTSQSSNEIPDVSILIVSWNTCELLRICLLSIEAKVRGVTYEIVVVDNASGDGTVSMLQREFPSCRLAINPKNTGFAHGNNTALRLARGRHILYLNPDTELITDAVSSLVGVLDNNPRIGAVGCRVLNADGTTQISCARSFPSPWKQLCYLTLLYRLLPTNSLFATVEMTNWDHLDTRDVECLSGACMMVRGALAHSMGGFNEQFFMYAEDTEMCFRIRKAGWRVRYIAEEKLFHFSGKSSTQRKPSFAEVLPREAEWEFLRLCRGKGAATAFKIATAAGSIFRIGILSLMRAFHQGRNAGHDECDAVMKKYIALLKWSVGLLKKSEVVA